MHGGRLALSYEHHRRAAMGREIFRQSRNKFLLILGERNRRRTFNTQLLGQRFEYGDTLARVDAQAVVGIGAGVADLSLQVGAFEAELVWIGPLLADLLAKLLGQLARLQALDLKRGAGDMHRTVGHEVVIPHGVVRGRTAWALVVHDQTSRTGIDRRDGFVDRMKAAHPQVEIVDIQYGAGDQLQSTEIAKAILTANPDLKGMFGANEGSAIGVLNAVAEMNRPEVVVIGYDSGVQQKEAIRSGKMAGAITQNPVGIGYETVKAAVAAARGEAVPKTIDTGFYWFDKSNIDDPTIAAVLYD